MWLFQKRFMNIFKLIFESSVSRCQALECEFSKFMLMQYVHKSYFQYTSTYWIICINMLKRVSFHYLVSTFDWWKRLHQQFKWGQLAKPNIFSRKKYFLAKPNKLNITLVSIILWLSLSLSLSHTHMIRCIKREGISQFIYYTEWSIY